MNSAAVKILVYRPFKETDRYLSNCFPKLYQFTFPPIMYEIFLSISEAIFLEVFFYFCNLKNYYW